MGTKYTTQDITGNNANPPPDNASTGTDNKVAWVNHVTKIGNPIVDQADRINTAILDMVDVDTVAYAANYTTVEDDNGRVLAPCLVKRGGWVPDDAFARDIVEATLCVEHEAGAGCGGGEPGLA